MENIAQQATPESVWAFLQEMAKQHESDKRLLAEMVAETKRQQEENSRQMAENNRFITKLQAETEKQIRALTEQVTGISKSNGLYAEDYFFNSFARDELNIFGEKYDRIIHVKGKNVNDEYDFVLINGKTACIIEVKYKARNDDIAKALKKPSTFRINFPEYQNHRIYLAIAAFTIQENIELKCHNEGIAVIKQVGDKVIVCDKNLKEF